MNQTELEQQIIKFSRDRWPDSTIVEAIGKLYEEIGELAEAVCQLHLEDYRCRTFTGFKFDEEYHKAKDAVLSEAGDCAIVLTRLLGFLAASLQQETAKKFNIIKDRPPDSKQVYSNNWKELSTKLLGKENGSVEDLMKLYRYSLKISARSAGVTIQKCIICKKEYTQFSVSSSLRCDECKNKEKVIHE